MLKPVNKTSRSLSRGDRSVYHDRIKANDIDIYKYDQREERIKRKNFYLNILNKCRKKSKSKPKHHFLNESSYMNLNRSEINNMEHYEPEKFDVDLSIFDEREHNTKSDINQTDTHLYYHYTY